ncbi:MAG: sigma 54-interacting transcriptional regulator [Deltaproteobacteria bacterium]|nr:sigma 54-interacting transcriptional regulator [Deltaproteobacteria bacterium]
MEFDNDNATDKVKPDDTHETEAHLPGLLVAYSVDTKGHADGVIPLTFPAVAGRRSTVSNILFDDTSLSKRHFQIRFERGQYYVDDLNSTNGTFVNGVRIKAASILHDGDLIRAGENIFVFQENVFPFLTPPDDYFGFKGRFYSGILINTLKRLINSEKYLLLTGPSGSGKDLAANAFAQMRKQPMLTHNASSFSTDEEAVTTLQGVESHVFSGVSARSGLIEDAKDGILFMNEYHNYSARVQRVLLLILEGGAYTRTGGKQLLESNAFFIFASNEGGPNYGLANDVLGRLKNVSVPGLCERRADIPELFQFFLSIELNSKALQPKTALSHYRAVHYEHICLANFGKHNIRELKELADEIATNIQEGAAPRWSLFQALNNKKKHDRNSAAKKGRHENSASFDTPAKRIANYNCDEFGEQEGSSVRTIDMMTQSIVKSRANTKPGKFSVTPKGSTGEQKGIGKYKDQIWEEYEKSGGNISAVCRTLNLMGIEISDKTLKKYIKRWGYPTKRQLKANS